jgi:hypothetical protein
VEDLTFSKTIHLAKTFKYQALADVMRRFLGGEKKGENGNTNILGVPFNV